MKANSPNLEPIHKAPFPISERVAVEKIKAKLEALSTEPILKALLDTVGAVLLVLNRNRQILFASHELLKTLNIPETPVGLRPGEALNCTHAWDNPGGCGMSEACATCGAALALFQTEQTGLPAERECLLRTRKGEVEDSREFRVKASPVTIQGEECTLFCLTDISSEKRRETLERFFFHDILNTVQALVGWSRILNAPGAARHEAAAKKLGSLSERLSHEIEDHRMLLMAERGVLKTKAAPVPVNRILDFVDGIFGGHDVAEGRRFEIARTKADEQLLTDDSLVVRVISNMVKNALEATPSAGIVRLWTECDAGSVRFCVWNEGVIPRRIALQIFCRSFSTKGGNGRGIGTFSMKLLGERYLGGKVQFTSTALEGTIFSLTLPR